MYLLIIIQRVFSIIKFPNAFSRPEYIAMTVSFDGAPHHLLCSFTESESYVSLTKSRNSPSWKSRNVEFASSSGLTTPESLPTSSASCQDCPSKHPPAPASAPMMNLRGENWLQNYFMIEVVHISLQDTG